MASVDFVCTKNFAGSIKFTSACKITVTVQFVFSSITSHIQ